MKDIYRPLGSLVGQCLYLLNTKSRKIAFIDTARCFPERSRAEVEDLVKHHFIEQARLRIKAWIERHKE
jgi:lauroyl/myristoyl acyltransferase